MILVAGDKDYVPVVHGIFRRGFVSSFIWIIAANELKGHAAKFCSLNRSY